MGEMKKREIENKKEKIQEEWRERKTMFMLETQVSSVFKLVPHMNMNWL